MAGREPDDAPQTPREYELEDQIARFDENQRNRYDAQIDVAIQRNGNASLGYRIDLADTFLQSFPPHIEAQQVRDLNRREDARVQQQLAEPTRPGPALNSV